MLTRLLVPALSFALAAAAPTTLDHAVHFWPPWISIESPVNPFDPTTRGSVFLVHAQTHDGVPTLQNVTATAEGLVGGARRTVAVALTTTSRPGVFAVRKQWPAEGTWLVVVTLYGTTTALVALDGAGAIAYARVPMQTKDPRLPRTPTAAEIDSTLATLAASQRDLASH